MNIRKNIDYTEMYSTLNILMKQQLPQMELYCAIGKAVCQRAEKGAAVMAAEYLHENYPDVPGFSPRNARRMRDFYRTYENHPQLLKLAMQIGWIQNVVIMEADLTMELREWYMKAVKQFGWSKAGLTANIEAKAHENITLEIDEEVCYNEEKMETREAAIMIFASYIARRIHRLNGCWNYHRKEHRRRWRTMLWRIFVEMLPAISTSEGPLILEGFVVRRFQIWAFLYETQFGYSHHQFYQREIRFLNRGL